MRKTLCALTLAALAAIGCGRGEDGIDKIAPEPVTGEYNAISEDGNYAIFTRKFNTPEEDIVSINTNNTLESKIIYKDNDENLDPVVLAIVKDKAIVEVVENFSVNRDVEFIDIKTGQKINEIKTPSKNVMFYYLIDNDSKALLRQWDISGNKYLVYDPVNNTLTDLFPADKDANMNWNYGDEKRVVSVEDFAGNLRAYSFEPDTAVIAFLEDLTGTGATEIFNASISTAIAYDTVSDIVFKQPGGNQAIFPKTNPTSSYYPARISKDGTEAAIIEKDGSTTNLHHVNLNTGAIQQIDTSAFNGWEGIGDVSFSSPYVVIKGNSSGSGYPNVLFYDPSSNQLLDLLTPMISGTIINSTAWSSDEHNNKLPIGVAVDNGGVIREEFVHHDNGMFNMPIIYYDDVWVRYIGVNSRFLLINGRNKDAIGLTIDTAIFSFDQETGIPTEIAQVNSPRGISSDAYHDGSKVIYTVFGADNRLGYFDQVTGTNNFPLKISTNDFTGWDLSRNNQKIVVRELTPSGNQYSIVDTNTGKETFLAHEE